MRLPTRTPRVLLGLWILAAIGVAFAEERFEAFDTDPLWEGRNNRSQAFDVRIIRQDFGYSPTNHAGGRARGEFGGFITPAAEPAYYGKVIEPRTLDEPLTASGVFLADGRQFHILLGFFNSSTLNEWRTPNSVVLRLYGRGDAFYAYVEYATAKWRAGGDSPKPFAHELANGRRKPIEFARGKPHRWTLNYEPQANDGRGSITATINGAEAICDLAEGHRVDGAAFNRFGVQNVMKHADSGGEVWLDDLQINGENETFDTDPRWDGRNNRRRSTTADVRPRFDFGYSQSQLAGGERSGEIGGLVFRGDCRDANRMAYYGDRIGSVNLARPLRASGRLSLCRAVSDSTTLFGFFHSEESMQISESQSSGFPRNFLGIVIEGPSRDGFFVYPAYRLGHGDAAWADGAARPHVYPNGRSHNWKLEFTPADKDPGTITVHVDGQPIQLSLPEGQHGADTEFNRFGIVTTWIDGNGQRVYFDDVTYTCRQ